MRKYALPFVAMTLLMLPLAYLQFPLNAQQATDAAAKSASQLINRLAMQQALKCLISRHAYAAELIHD